MTINLVDGFTLTISDPDNLLGSNQAALITDMNYVVTLLSTYIVFQKPLDLQITFAPASQNPNNTDGLLPSAPAWVNYQGKETLAAMVKGQTGVAPNGVTADAGFTFYAGNDGTLKNFGSPFWFDPNPILGQNPSIPTGATDFIGVATHELFHCFGFASWPALNAPWNQHTVEVNGVWYYSSPAVNNLLGGMLPLAPNTDGTAADHIGDTSIPYQPIRSDLMYQFGNYTSNRLDIGLLDLTILHDLGWTIQNYDSLPLVDPLDASDISGTSGNDTVTASHVSSEILTGNGNDTIILPSAAGNGDYDIDGGTGYNVALVNRQSSNFNVVAYDNNYLLQSVTGSDGVSILKNVEVVRFIDKSIAIRTRTGDDFSQSGTSDILFRGDASGDTGFYAISNGTSTGWHEIAGSSTSYSVVGVGDFFGNGTSDVLFRNNTNGDTGFYAISNGTFAGWREVGASSTAYSVVGVGDFFGSGTSDILFRNNTTGDTGFYRIVNGANAGWLDVGASSTAYSVVGVGDFNGDGISDILYRNNTTGDTGFYAIANGANTGWHDIGGSSTAYAVVGVGDFLGTGTDDVLYRNNTTGDTGFFAIVNGVNTGWRDVGGSSTAYSVVGVGDYNGSGTSDILFRNNTTGDTGFYAIANGVNTGWHDVGASSAAYHVVG